MKKILIVDDDILIQRLLKEELEEDGHNVSIASNGKEALSVLLNKTEKPDLIILDLRMPGINGLDTLVHLLKLKHELPVIIYTAYGTYKSDPLAKAAQAYIVKSSDTSELKFKVNKLLAGMSPDF